MRRFLFPQQLLRRFSGDRKGAVAILFAIAIFPIMGLVAAAVDYSRAAKLQAKIQAALDAAAISASTRAQGRTPAQVLADAQAIFNAQMANEGISITLTAQLTGSTLQLNAQYNMPTTFLPVAGIPQVPIATMSKTQWGATRLRVALALDNTGSMASAGKMDALKTSTLNLISQLQSSARVDGDVYVSLVPFAKVVNVGTQYNNATWIKWDDATVCNWRGTCSVVWDGAIQDRDQNYDISNAAPTNNSTRFPALATNETGGTPVEIQPLTYNWGQLRSTVARMTPAGNTNQGIGLAWAWQTLTSGAPMNAPAEDPLYTYRKVIILLSDGQNTESRFYSYASQIDARQRLMCDAVKAAGITIYTIQINTGGDPVSSVMQYCASSSNKFTYLTAASQLQGVMSDIAGQLTSLRLTN